MLEMKNSPGIQGEALRTRKREALVALVLLLMSCVTLDKLFDLSGWLLRALAIGWVSPLSAILLELGRAQGEPWPAKQLKLYVSLAPGPHPSHNVISGPFTGAWFGDCFISEMPQIMRK